MTHVFQCFDIMYLIFYLLVFLRYYRKSLLWWISDVLESFRVNFMFLKDNYFQRYGQATTSLQGCLQQISLGLFLNTLSHIYVCEDKNYIPVGSFIYNMKWKQSREINIPYPVGKPYLMANGEYIITYYRSIQTIFVIGQH